MNTILEMNAFENEGPLEDERPLAGKMEKMDTFFFEFIVWIMEESMRHGVMKLYFFTREGEFFSRIYHVVERYGFYPAKMSEMGKKNCLCRMPEAEVLEVSRMSTFMPSLQEISVREMMRIWNVYPRQSMETLFRSLQVADRRLWEYLEKYKINAGEMIHRPWKDARIRQLFKDSGFIACMEAERDRQRERLYAYFAAKGWEKDSPDAVGIVDIGWKGTIQDNLCNLYPGRKIIGFYIGLQPFVSPQPVNSEKYGFLDGYARQKDVLLTVRPLEMLCNSPNGSVTGYAYRENAAGAKQKNAGSSMLCIAKKDPLERDGKADLEHEPSVHPLRKKYLSDGNGKADLEHESSVHPLRKKYLSDGNGKTDLEHESSVYAVRKKDLSEDKAYYEYAALEQKKILRQIQHRCRRHGADAKAIAHYKKIWLSEKALPCSRKNRMTLGSRHRTSGKAVMEISGCARHWKTGIRSRAANRKKAQRAVYRYIAYPDRRAVKAYFSLKHNEEFGIGRYVDVKAGTFRPDLLLQAVFTRRGRKRLKAVLKESEWPQGYLVRYWMHLLLYPYNVFLHRYLEKEKPDGRKYMAS